MGLISKIRKAKYRPDPKKDNQRQPEYFSREMGNTYRQFWDGMARTREGAYLGVAGLPFGEPATEESLDRHGVQTAEIIAQKLRLSENDVILEVGVGVGRLAKPLAPLVREFHGVDISSNMVKIARERCAHVENAFFYALSSSDLSLFPSNKFDALYFQIALIHLDREDAYHYLREAKRVLKPGGRLWAQFYNLLHPKGFKEFEFAVEHGLAQGGKARGRVHCYTADEARKFIEAAGFIVDEDKSHLEKIDQKFDFDMPDLDWEYYLIAMATKP